MTAEISPTPVIPLEDIKHGDLLRALEESASSIVHGKRDVIRLCLVALLARGHLLLEDVPGVGKTTLARTLARTLGVSFQRLQFTSDLLPSDILGVSVFKQANQEFEFQPGPVFANVILADEINRATPKTQSALLEAMSEAKVTVDGTQHPLPQPFLVIATQNPLEHHGTFPLPESQLDRFMMRLEVGYPELREERALLMRGGIETALETLEPVLDGERLARLQRAVPRVKVAEKLVDYMLQLAERTRNDPRFRLGVSTRGAQALYRAVQALALIEQRDFAVPDDVIRLAGPVLAHRVIARTRDADAESLIEQLLGEIPVPV